MSIAENLKTLRQDIPENVKLVCVSKFHPVDELQEAYDAGERIFGESRVQELTEKQPQLPTDIQWHFIGHLQTNKIKYIAPFVSLIHSIDSFKLLKEIDKQAAKNNRTIDCLLQLHIAEEDTKFGFTRDELVQLLESDDFAQLQNIRVVGLMGMATYTDDEKQVAKEFADLKNIFEEIKNRYFNDVDTFKELSMGMSQDYKIGITQGSTMIRIGTAIFGSRGY